MSIIGHFSNLRCEQEKHFLTKMCFLWKTKNWKNERLQGFSMKFSVCNGRILWITERNHFLWNVNSNFPLLCILCTNISRFFPSFSPNKSFALFSMIFFWSSAIFFCVWNPIQGKMDLKINIQWKKNFDK